MTIFTHTQTGRPCILISGTPLNTENLIVAVRSQIANAERVREVKMFGGTGFMLDGNLLAGVSQRGLLVRVGKDQHRQAVEMGARPVVMRGRTMTGYVRIDAEPLDEGAVRSWVVLAAEFVKGLPPKASGSKPRRTARAKK